MISLGFWEIIVFCQFNFWLGVAVCSLTKFARDSMVPIIIAGFCLVVLIFIS